MSKLEDTPQVEKSIVFCYDIEYSSLRLSNVFCIDMFKIIQDYAFIFYLELDYPFVMESMILTEK